MVVIPSAGLKPKSKQVSPHFSFSLCIQTAKWGVVFLLNARAAMASSSRFPVVTGIPVVVVIPRAGRKPVRCGAAG